MQKKILNKANCDIIKIKLRKFQQITCNENKVVKSLIHQNTQLTW